MGHGHCQECGRRVRGQHPLLISKAFEVGTVHFGPRLLAGRRVPEDDLRGVVRQDRAWDSSRCWVSPWRAPHCVVPPQASCPACQAHPRCLGRRRCGPAPSFYADETGWKQGGPRVWLWVFTNLRETVYEILPGRGFEQAASVLGKNYAGTLGVDGWAP